MSDGPPAPAAVPPGLSPARPTQDLLIGTTVMGYLIKGRVGAGGMGIVYEGEQEVIGKRVAVKVLRPEVAEKPEQVEALVSEARAVNKVGHRGIIDVFGFALLPDGRQCIVMELLEGQSLAEVLNENREAGRVMPVGEVMLILEEVLSALGAAHGAGVIHRDIKPSNIFLARQRGGGRYVKLLDFGIAKLDSATPASGAPPSMIIGTPAYMAPEQARRGPVTPALDLYAVGVIAFELLTNRIPFDGENVVEVLVKHAQEPAPRPSSLLMSIPDEVDDIVLSLLQKNPEDRPSDANKIRLLVKRVRKLLVHSTQHPELQLTRDKKTGKLKLEERARGDGPLVIPGGSAPARAPAPAPSRRTALPPPPAKEAPRPKTAVRSQEADDAGEATLPELSRAPAPVSVPPAPPASSSSKVAVFVVVGLVLAAGAVAFGLRQHLRPSGPAIVEIVPDKKAGPSVDALKARLDALDQRLTAAAAEGKNMQAVQKRAGDLRATLSTADAAALDAQVSELEGGLGY